MNGRLGAEQIEMKRVVAIDFMGSALLPALPLVRLKLMVVFSLKISRCSVRFRNCNATNNACRKGGISKTREDEYQNVRRYLSLFPFSVLPEVGFFNNSIKSLILIWQNNIWQ